MNRILAIDSGTDFLSVALWEERVVLEKTAFVPKQHSELLPKFVDDALIAKGLSPADISCVALAIGPGSYTGLRVGVAFVQGFVLCTNAKIIAVDSLLAQAGRYCLNDLPVAVIIDARAGYIYGGIFDVRTAPIAIKPSALSKPNEFAKELSSRGRVILCGSGAQQFLPSLNQSAKGTEFIIPYDSCIISAGIIAQMAFGKMKQGEFVAPETLEPAYLRDFVPGVRKRKPIIG